MNTELEALQNSATMLNLTVHEKYMEDKRRTVKKYFLQKGTETVSPVLTYDQLNYFLSGWHRAVKA